MCDKCHQPEWYCQTRPDYGSKVIKNESSGYYGALVLDFDKKTILIHFPSNWEEMTLAQQSEWIMKKIKQDG